MITLYGMINDDKYSFIINQSIKYLSQTQMKTYGVQGNTNDPVVQFKVVDDNNNFIFYKFILLKLCINLNDDSVLLTCTRTGRQLKLPNDNTYNVIIRCKKNPVLSTESFLNQMKLARLDFYKEASYLTSETDFDQLVADQVLKKTGTSTCWMWDDQHPDIEKYKNTNYNHGPRGIDNNVKLLHTALPKQGCFAYLKQREVRGY